MYWYSALMPPRVLKLVLAFLLEFLCLVCWARWQWRPGCHQCYSGATLVGPIRQHQILRLQQKKVKHLVACWTRLDLWTDLSTWVVGRGKYENEKQQPTHFGSNSLLSGWACLLIMSCCKAAYLPVLTINAARCSLSVPQNIALCRAVYWHRLDDLSAY